MSHNPHSAPRKSPRLMGYDYAQEGAYFVTICVQHRLALFGEIREQQMCMNAAGQMIAARWLEIPEHYPNAEPDLFVVMPNHMHGIVVIAEHQQVALSRLLQWFKTMTTTDYIRGVKNEHWQPFTGKLWQRSFNDRILRNERELNIRREYILNNPARWTEDEFYG